MTLEQLIREKPVLNCPGAGNESKVYKMEPTGRYQVIYPFGWYIRKFAEDAREKGAIAIVLSHTPRNMFDDGKIARNTKSFGAWSQQSAEESGAYYIDLNKISGDKFEKIAWEEGLGKVAEYFKKDHTHTSLKGARLNAQSIAEGLLSTDCPLKDYLK